MKILTNKNKLLITFLFLGFSTSSVANLIEDGGFEYAALQSGWTWFATDDNSPDSDNWAWTGDNMEIWKSGFHGVNSPEGSHHAELRAHGGNNDGWWTIAQTFDSSSFASLDFSFMHRARANENEAFTFSVMTNGSTTSWAIDNDFVWKPEFFSLDSIGDTTTISFSVETNSTVGSFIDDVIVTGEPGEVDSSSIPEPSLLGLFGLAIIGLGIKRFRALT